MQKGTALLVITLCLAHCSYAQTAGDTVVRHSPIRSLTDGQYNAYLKGTYINDMALVGIINHYPLPDEVVQYKKELDLSPTQLIKLNDIVKFLKLKKTEIGQSVIRNEKMLDSLFRTKKVDDGIIVFYGNRYGLYEGEYRTAFLLACYKTENVLTPQQIKKFEQLQKHS